MKITELLERLSPPERKELIRRRGLRPTSHLTDQALASYLGDRHSVATALAELNAFQMLLLRWLAEEPGQRSSWSNLLAQVKGRVTVESLEAQFRDLRLLGLADYDPDPKDGFIVTAPSIVAALPAFAPLLRDYLPQVSPDTVRLMCRALAGGPASKRPDECVKAILAAFGQPRHAQNAVSRLPVQARRLFEEMRAGGGSLPAADILDRSNRPRGSRLGPDGVLHGLVTGDGPLSDLVRCCLALPVNARMMYPGWYDPVATFAIPVEVERALRQGSMFDGGSLFPPKILGAEGAVGAAPGPMLLIRDLFHLLGFIGSGRCSWRQDGQPYQRSLSAFGKMIGSADSQYPDILWRMARVCRLVAYSANWRYEPADLGQVTPGWLVRQVLDGWATAAPSRNQSPVPVSGEARTRLLTVMRLLPPDTWVLKQSVGEFLAFAWPLLFGKGGSCGTREAQEELWASTWCLPIAQGKTPDGKDALMVPKALHALLEEEAGEGKAVTDSDLLPPWEEGWVVQPDRSVVAPPNAHPAALLELWSLADLESNQGASIFRVTRQSVAGALNRGMTPKEALGLLVKRSRTPLPATVEQIIADEGARYGRIKVGPASAFVMAEDSADLEAVMGDRKLQELEWRQVAPGVAVVEGVAAPALLQTIRNAGYLPVPAPPGKKARKSRSK